MTEQIKNIPVGQIVWRDGDNASRINGLYKNDSDRHALTELLLPGWNSGLGRVLITPMTEDEQAEAADVLSAELGSLQGLNVEPEKVALDSGTKMVALAEKLAAFTATRMKNGKIVTPKYRGVTCFRRGGVLVLVNTLRMKNGDDPIAELPCVIREYADQISFISDNVLENEGRDAGARRLNSGDRILIAKRLYGLGASEAKLQKAFAIGRGMAQKYHRICKLDAMAPKSNIIDRMVSDEDADANVKFASFDKEKIKTLIDDGANAEKIEAFIEEPNKGNKDKIMDRKGIELLEEQSPVLVVKLVLKAVIANDTSKLDKLVANAEKVNEALASLI